MDYRGFMETIEMSPEEMINYYKREQAGQTYGWTFFQDEICRMMLFRMDYGSDQASRPMHDKILPLFFYDKGYDKKWEQATGEKINRLGQFNANGVQAHIEIPLDGKTANLTPTNKRTIRHEIIHYALWAAGLPFKDDDTEFWCLCHAFDAGAYEIPTDEDKIKYIQLFCRIYDENNIKKIKSYHRNIIIGIMVDMIHSTDIDKYEEECLKEIAKFKQYDADIQERRKTAKKAKKNVVK